VLDAWVAAAWASQILFLTDCLLAVGAGDPELGLLVVDTLYLAMN
jgi:hypothetical protein